MTTEYTEAELASMTPAEREAVGEELNDRGPSVTVDDSELEAANAAKAVADEAARVAAATATAQAAEAADPDKAAAPAAAAATQAAQAPAAPAAAPDDRPFVPVFKAATVVTDEEHTTAQGALATQFENGEITTPQFIVENEKLTRAKMESDIASRQSEQVDTQTWQYEQERFFNLPGNAVIRDDARVWAAMQAQLETLYADPEKAKYSNGQYLREAGSEVLKLFGLDATKAAPAAPAKPAAKPAEIDGVTIPATLAGLPTAEANADAIAGEFGHIEKLDGMEYENAVARLTPEQRTRWLNS
jgi:hypothetical protein